MNDDGRTLLGGGRVVTPDETVSNGTVVIENGTIEAVERNHSGPVDVETSDRIVLPGLIDLHGDDIERHLFPRADDRIPVDRAVQLCDQATIAAGVTTKCHALAFEDTPDDNRSLALAGRVAETIRSFDDGLADHRLHLRCELTSRASVRAVRERIDDDAVALASLVTHVPGDGGQFDSPEEYASRYGDGASVSTDRMNEVVRERSAVPDRTCRARSMRVLERANEAGVPVAAHDSSDPDTVRRQADDGVGICEFPVNLAAARAATGAGLRTAMGAPNLVRGQSMWNNLSAMRAIHSGTVDLLCSDFRPHSLLKAAFVDTGEPLADRVARVTATPADAIGLDDRGRLEPGARADVLVVDPSPEPRVVRAFAAGREVYRATPRGATGTARAE